MKRFHLFLFSIVFCSTGFATGSGSGGTTSTGPAHLIFNNVKATTDKAIFTNLNTAGSSECSKSDALYETRCNSFALGDNEIQVIQSDGTGNLVNQIGINNENSASYNNYGTENQLNYFTPGKHLFDINKYRNAADKLATKPTGLPGGTYGTISFSQFVNNVANARPMYGIVRVKVPLTSEPGTDAPESEKSDTSAKFKTSVKSGKRSKYRLCGEKPTPACLLCGPGVGTDLKPGQKICGSTLGANAKILVYGSLFFDWVDCKTENPIPLSELPESPRDIYFSVSVPINVNPANVDAAGTMASLGNIPAILGSSKCPTGSPCDLPVTNSIPYSLVTTEAKEQYAYDTGSGLTEDVFNALPQTQKFALLFPSGYEKGWEKAFSTLGITPSYWKSLEFDTPDSAGFIEINHIRSDLFEDIPSYMYTGGLIDMHHHVNISGLVYVPQAIELEQKGLTLGEDGECKKESKHKDDDDDDHHDKEDEHADSDDHGKSPDSHKTTIHSLSAMTSRSMEKEHEKEDKDDHEEKEKDHDDEKCAKKDDDHDDDEHHDKDKHGDDEDDDEHHEKDHDDKGPGSIVFIPASQYINGAILVRDSFYIEAKQPGGVTIINNDPNTYSNIKLSTESSTGGKFQTFPTAVPGGTTGGDDSGSGGSGGSGSGGTPGSGSGSGSGGSGSSGGASTKPITNPGAQWIEIRPR